MRGVLHKTEQGWIVEYAKHSELPLHPDDVKQIEEDAKVFDNIEARISAYPEVDFIPITDAKINMVTVFAKLVPFKEQQKQLITEIMDLDAKDGLYEDEVDKLAHQYNPVMKLDAEFIRAGFKAGYNKAKETLYTEISDEEIEKAAKECRFEDLDISVGSFELGAKWYREQLKQK
jgi:hypothetical protein